MQVLSEAQAKFGDGNNSAVSFDTSRIEENQKQQALLTQIQNRILAKILEIISRDAAKPDDSNVLKNLYKMMNELGLKDRKITKYQMG
jgi:hypothetical protein